MLALTAFFMRGIEEDKAMVSFRWFVLLALAMNGVFNLPATKADLLLGQNFLIPMTTPKDSVYDAQRGILYSTRSNSLQISRYDVVNRVALSPFTINSAAAGLNGLDMSPDGQTLYVATQSGSTTTAAVEKIDLNTGVDNSFSYPTDSGGYDIVTTSNGKAFLTSNSVAPVRQIDLSNNNVTNRTDAPGSFGPFSVRDRTGLFTSADRKTMFVWEGNISSGPGFVYDAVTNSFGSARNLNYSWVSGASVNRDGTLISTPGSGPYNFMVRNRSLDPVRDMGVISGGIFDPVRDRLYLLNNDLGKIIAFDTNTWNQEFQFSSGETILDSRYFQQGYMTIGSDGKYLFINTNTGIRVYGVPEPASLSLLAIGALAMWRRNKVVKSCCW